MSVGSENPYVSDMGDRYHVSIKDPLPVYIPGYPLAPGAPFHLS